jgi:hypothetical protein
VSACIIPWPRRVPQCENCLWLVPPGSATEIAHHKCCTVPREKAEARERRREQWRQEDYERKASRARAPAERLAPVSPRQPSAWHRQRLVRLRFVLPDQVMAEALTDATGLPTEALERVAAGKSTLAATQWRRVLTVLGLAGE